MIKLVQGFTIGSPLPIDGRLLLSKDEMINNIYIDPDTGESINLDNILPDHYFAICTDKDDNRLYLYNKKAESKNNEETKEFGKFVLADKQLDDKINENYNELDTKILANYIDLESQVADLSSNLNSKIHNVSDNLDLEIERATSKENEINARLSNEESRVSNYIESNDERVSAIETDISDLNAGLSSERQIRLENDNEIRQSIIAEQHERAHYDNEQLSLINANTAKINQNKAAFDTHVSETNTKFSNIDTDIDNINSNIADLRDYTELLDETIDINRSSFDTYVINNNQAISGINTDISNINDEIDSTNERIDGLSESIDTRFSTTNNHIDLVEGRVAVNEEAIVSLNETDNVLRNDLNTARSDINTINNNIDKVVVTSVDPIVQHPDSILIIHKNINIKTGVENVEQDHLPLANSVNAGLMSPTDVVKIQQMQGQIASISGGSSRLLFISENKITDNSFKVSYTMNESGTLNSYTVTYTLYDTSSADSFYIMPSSESQQEGTLFRCNGDVDSEGNYLVTIYEINSATDPIVYAFDIENEKIYRYPTAESINSFAIDQGQIAPFSGVAVVVSETNHIWRYYPNEEEGIVIGWVDEGIDTVLHFTNENPGIIKGAGEKEGYVYAESTGEGSVYGWSNLVDNVTNNSNSITRLESDKVDKVLGKSLIDDFEIDRLANIASNANNVAKGTNNGDLSITTRLNGEESTAQVNVYTHPIGSAVNVSEGFYKIATDENSHVKSLTNVNVSDITNLNPYVAGNGISINKNLSTGVVTISEKNVAAVSIPNSLWLGTEFPYTAEIILNGVNVNSTPSIDIDTSAVESREDIDNLYLNWSYVYKAETSENTITFYASKKPTMALNVFVKGY